MKAPQYCICLGDAPRNTLKVPPASLNAAFASLTVRSTQAGQFTADSPGGLRAGYGNLYLPEDDLPPRR